jgi:uncharacterized membrane protein YjgN (DUF898 family)
MDSAVTQSRQEARRAETLAFTTAVSGSDFVKLGLIQGLLNLVTLTLYRFWARTEVRRRFWAGTSLNGESFEYTGTGGELFKGFLIALVVFTIPYLVVLFGGQLMPPAIGIPLILAFVLFAFWAIGAAIWLSFRYIASRTVWRGIRFRLRGSAVAYGWLVFGQSILTTITLGWYGPRAFIKQAEGLWGDLSFGDLPFAFDEAEARKESLYPRFAFGWVGSAIAYFALIGGGIAWVMGSGFVPDPEDPAANLAMMAVIYAAAFVLVLFILLLFLPYDTACLRALVRALKLDEATFQLVIRTPAYMVLQVTNTLIIIFSLGFLIPVAQARTWKFMFSHLTAEGVVDLSQASQVERGPSQAEGLADAFDVGII